MVVGEIKETSEELGFGSKVNEEHMILVGCISSVEKITKHEVAQCISQVFEPLGYLLPVTIKTRIFLQDIWSTKLNGHVSGSGKSIQMHCATYQ